MLGSLNISRDELLSSLECDLAKSVTKDSDLSQLGLTVNTAGLLIDLLPHLSDEGLEHLFHKLLTIKTHKAYYDNSDIEQNRAVRNPYKKPTKVSNDRTIEAMKERNKKAKGYK